MFKKSLVLLTATAFMLPAGYTVNVVSADEYSAREARQERARQSRPKAKSTYKQRAPRQRGSSSSRRTETKSSYQREEQAARQQSTSRKVSSPQQSRVRASSGGGQQAGVQTQRVTRTPRGTSQPTTRAIRRTTTRTQDTVAREATGNRVHSNVTKTRAAHPRAVSAKGDARRTPRNATRSTRATSRDSGTHDGSSAANQKLNQQLNRQAAAAAYDREIYNRGAYAAGRSTRDARRAARSTHGGSGEYYYNQGKTRRLDPRRGASNANWDRGRVRDYARGSYKRNWHRNRRYRDWDVYFGFSPFYYGLGYNSSYLGGHYNGYYSGHYYGRNQYYGHWPFTAGYYHARASWGWYHSHQHYHYGSYCPYAHNNGAVAYNDHSYYASSTSDETALSMLLGGVVGGIIGAEIDGGHNKTTGTVVGAIVGAAIGASAANADSDVVHYPKTGVVYDAEGRHAYENEAYLPPREIKTCLRYETRNKEHICTKWTVEYVYDDD